MTDYKTEPSSFSATTQRNVFTTPKDKETQDELWNLLLEHTGGGIQEAQNILKRESSFTSREGHRIEGKSDVKHLTGKWLGFTYHRVKELCEAAYERDPGE